MKWQVKLVVREGQTMTTRRIVAALLSATLAWGALPTAAIADSSGGDIVLPEISFDYKPASNGGPGTDNETELSDEGVYTSIGGANVEGIADVIYSGSPVVLGQLSLTLDGKALKSGVDYDWYASADMVDAGTYEVTFEGKGAYNGTKKTSFRILPAEVSAASIAEIPSQDWTGSTLKPELALTFNGRPMTLGTDYTLKYANNVDPGTATVTVTGMGNFTGTTTTTFQVVSPVDPVAPAPQQRDITVNDKSVAMGTTVNLDATLTEGDGTLTYKSSDTSVAKVSSTGVVTPVKVGTAKVTITAAATDVYAKATKTVTVTVMKGTQSISVGATSYKKTYRDAAFSLDAAVSKGDGNLTFKSSDTGVVSVNKSGMVTLKGAGTAKVTITATETANWKKATRTVTITAAKCKQAISASNKSVAFGKTVSLGAKRTKGNGNLTYKSSNTAIAKVSSTGVVTPVKPGTVKMTITAAETANYLKATKTVTVTVTKGTQSMVVTAVTRTASYSTLKTKSVTVTKPLTISGSIGTKTYTRVGNSNYFTVNKTTGNVTIKKGTPKGTYTVKIKVTAAGNYRWKSCSKTVVCKVTVK